MQQTLRDLRAELAAQADPAHAQFHKGYHKSEQHFHGLRTPQLQAVWRALWPGRHRLAREDVLPLIDPLWESNNFEEALTAIHLLSRIATQLGPEDLPLLHMQTRRCTGWGQLDSLALRCLGPLALAQGAAVYAPVMQWLDDEWLWTRRAAILIHLIPGREGRLDPDYAWPSLAARLHETDFFIRKAVGWTLREIGKCYAPDVAAFVREHKPRMSGLTFREGTRNLPAALRAGL